MGCAGFVFSPWVFLAISDSTSWSSLRGCALPVTPCGCTGGMGTPLSYCHESWWVHLDLILPAKALPL